MEVLKNTAERFWDEVVLDQDFLVYTFKNSTESTLHFNREVNSDMIQFYFCIKGTAALSFNQGHYKLPVKAENSLLLYNPQENLPMNIALMKGAAVLAVLLPITKLHSFFSAEADYISFLNEENKGRKYYKALEINPSVTIVLNQIFSFNLHPTIKTLYFKAKIYELFSLYFHRPADADIEQCPFLADEENVIKIKKAKQIIIERMTEPPTLNELAQEINLPLVRLKEGFKQIYGDTVFGFLFDYKMEVARQLLDSQNYNVNEVGLKIGYSAASHFISAFKKKYGTTPKRYLMSLQEAV